MTSDSSTSTDDETVLQSGRDSNQPRPPALRHPRHLAQCYDDLMKYIGVECPGIPSSSESSDDDSDSLLTEACSVRPPKRRHPSPTPTNVEIYDNQLPPPAASIPQILPSATYRLVNYDKPYKALKFVRVDGSDDESDDSSDDDETKPLLPSQRHSSELED